MAVDLRQALTDFDAGLTQLYVQTLRVPRQTIEGFVARHGRRFEQIGVLQDYRLAHGPPKMCFKNAATAALIRADLEYVEGYAMHNEIQFPFLHAWCSPVGCDEVLDLTLRKPAEYQYVGLRVTREELVEQLMANQVYGLLDSGRGINLKFMESWVKKRQP